MGKDDFVRYIGDAFPGMFSRDFAEALFVEGAKVPARVGRSLAAEAGSSSANDRDEGDKGDGDGEDQEDTGAAPEVAVAAPPDDVTGGLAGKGENSSKRTGTSVIPLTPEAWNVQQFISHLMAISENVLL